jgi:predicted nucleic acid-binding protein
MSVSVFLDSNVLLYAIEESRTEKTALVAGWFRYLEKEARVLVSLQVLNEVANVLLKRGMPAEQVFQTVDRLSVFGSEPVSPETVIAARLVRIETGYAWWDCILLASAMENGCRVFLSEDLRDGHTIRGLTVLNPFRHSPPLNALH